MMQTLARWSLRHWLLVVVVLADMWIVVTGKAAGPLEYPRVSALLMLAFFGILIANSWRHDKDGSRPPIWVNLLLPCIVFAACVAGVVAVA